MLQSTPWSVICIIGSADTDFSDRWSATKNLIGASLYKTQAIFMGDSHFPVQMFWTSLSLRKVPTKDKKTSSTVLGGKLSDSRQPHKQEGWGAASLQKQRLPLCDVSLFPTFVPWATVWTQNGVFQAEKLPPPQTWFSDSWKRSRTTNTHTSSGESRTPTTSNFVFIVTTKASQKKTSDAVLRPKMSSASEPQTEIAPKSLKSKCKLT